MEETIKMDNKIFELYTLAELSYKNHFKFLCVGQTALFPIDWHQKFDYELKIEIIYEAIITNTLIVNTTKYQEFVNESNNKIYSLKK